MEAEIRKEFRTEIANLRDEFRQNGSSKASEYEIQQYKKGTSYASCGAGICSSGSNKAETDSGYESTLAGERYTEQE